MSQTLSWVPGHILLWGAVVLFGLSTPVIQRLMELGAAYPVNGQNPISLCNILFVGNVCALPALWGLYRKETTASKFQALTGREWVILLIVAILGGALGPALLLQSLTLTSVNAVILVGRIEPLLLLVASVWIFREPATAAQWWGTGLAFSGGLITLSMPTPGLPIGQGEALVVLATLITVIATVLGQYFLQAVSPSLSVLVRTFIGTVVFFMAAWLLFGPEHFAAAFSPIIWQWMVFYGVGIVAIGQLLWFSGLRRSSLTEAALANSLLPIVGIIGAYGILGILPSPIQWVSVMLILVGILVARGGLMRWHKQI